MNNAMDNNQSNNKQALSSGIPREPGKEPVSDSRALQELIDILKEPFQTTCDDCEGEGIFKNGKVCATCKGKGKIMEKVFR